MLNNIGLPGLVLILLVLIFPVTTAIMASNRGRSPLLWFFVSIASGGVLGFFLMFVAEETRRLSQQTLGAA